MVKAPLKAGLWFAANSVNLVLIVCFSTAPVIPSKVEGSSHACVESTQMAATAYGFFGAKIPPRAALGRDDKICANLKQSDEGNLDIIDHMKTPLPRQGSSFAISYLTSAENQGSRGSLMFQQA